VNAAVAASLELIRQAVVRNNGPFRIPDMHALRRIVSADRRRNMLAEKIITARMH